MRIIRTQSRRCLSPSWATHRVVHGRIFALELLTAFVMASMVTACATGNFSVQELKPTLVPPPPNDRPYYVVGFKFNRVYQKGKGDLVAVKEYMERCGLVPAHCEYGIVVLKGGQVEGGGGWAEFACAASPEEAKASKSGRIWPASTKTECPSTVTLVGLNDYQIPFSGRIKRNH